MPTNSHAQAAREMVTYCLNNLPQGITQAQVKLPNAPFNTPNNAPYLRITINPLATVNHLATYAYQRTNGILTIDVFYPAGVGDRAAWAMAEEIQQAFTNRGTDHVSFFEVEIFPQGEDANRYHMQLDIYYSHEGKTYAD